MRKLFLFLLSLTCLMGWLVPVHAQGQAEVDLYPADASAFPTISAFLDVFDTAGRFVSGLKPDNATVLEDGHPIQVQELNEMVIPEQIVVAINPGPPLAIHDTLGVGRYQRLVTALDSWAQARPADMPDDLSLVTIAGPIIAHANTKDWLVSLNSFQPDFRSTTPNLQSLTIALDTLLAQPQRVGMKRAILFITPHMDDPNLVTALQPLLQRAIQNRIHIFVWFVDTDLYQATASAAAFTQLAQQTGGSFFYASQSQPFPDPETYFAPLRRLYALKYTSMVTSGGPHTVSLQVNSPNTGEIRSSDQAFNVDIQPPNPIFVSPPIQITRHAPQNDPYNTQVLVPDQQEIDIIVEFPDQHKRPLAGTTLYVDGQVMAKNSGPPFDKFIWDLGSYKESGEHKMVVEAVDTLGLSRTSMEIPVTVVVTQPPHGPAVLFSRYSQIITFAAIGFAGLVLLIIVFMGRMRMILQVRSSTRRAAADPLTQPVTMVVEPVAEVQKKRRRPRTGRPKAVNAPAYLVKLRPDGEPATANPIPLGDKELTFGTDPVQAQIVWDDPSLAPLHSRITRTEGGNFLLVDEGSVAGTWVNYEPVGKEGRLLRHGDVVHFGQLFFRFDLKNPPPEVEPKVIKETPST